MAATTLTSAIQGVQRLSFRFHRGVCDVLLFIPGIHRPPPVDSNRSVPALLLFLLGVGQDQEIQDAIRASVNVLLECREGNPERATALRGVYRVRNEIPIGYRIGGTSFSALRFSKRPAIDRAAAFHVHDRGGGPGAAAGPRAWSRARLKSPAERARRIAFGRPSIPFSSIGSGWTSAAGRRGRMSRLAAFGTVHVG